MAFESNIATFIGNLTKDPDLKFTQNGAAVVNLRVASSRKWTDRNGQEQEDTTFLDVVAWRDLAENVAGSLKKGDRVIVIGKLKVRSYQNNEDQTIWVTEIEADEIGPSLRWAQARSERSSSKPDSRSSSKDQGSPDPGPVPF
jgi:single-strand DNA-binding protein